MLVWELLYRQKQQNYCHSYRPVINSFSENYRLKTDGAAVVTVD